MNLSGVSRPAGLSRSLQAVDEVMYVCKYRHCLRLSCCTDHHLEYYCPGKAAQSSLTGFGDRVRLLTAAGSSFTSPRQLHGEC